MVENALYNAMDCYNSDVLQSNNYDQAWGSLFNFIGKVTFCLLLLTDNDDHDLLTLHSKKKISEYNNQKQTKKSPHRQNLKHRAEQSDDLDILKEDSLSISNHEIKH